MNPTHPHRPPHSPEIASELNNLLQIISGTSALIENIWEGKPGAEKYFEMLHDGVARAAEVTTELVELSGSINEKFIRHPNASAREIPPAKKSAAALPRPRLLVVDDEPALLVLAREFLGEAGYEVVTAASGFECLNQFRSGGRFDLVLLDLNMPLMDGQETFERLRALQPDLRVLLCTGYIQKERLGHMLEAGLHGFLQKPLQPRHYVDRVRAALAEVSFARCIPERNCPPALPSPA